MKPNDLELGNEMIGQIVGKILFELLPTLPLEFGPATFPGPRLVARELAMTKALAGGQTDVGFTTRPLPPPPAPKVEIPPPPPPKKNRKQIK